LWEGWKSSEEVEILFEAGLVYKKGERAMWIMA